jgi:lysine 2,3-aminomutase
MTNKQFKLLKTSQQLAEQKLIDHSDVDAISAVAEQFSIGLTKHVYDSIQSKAYTDPVFSQFVPKAEELTIQPEELGDPIADGPHEPVTGIVHRHNDRCLFMPVNVCPVYCRFCFRRDKIGQGSLTPEQTQNAYDYIRHHPEIWEVILTGGDPMITKPGQMADIICSLSAMEHVQVIRLHTRVPVTDPDRVNDDMIQALTQHRPVYVVLHANHPQELNIKAQNAIARLVDNGIVVLSQTVLLNGINDNAATMQSLMRKFVANRVKPYYLHHGDLAKGTSHFRTSIATGQRIMQALRRDLSGLCIPTYVLDIPGGHGKVPIGPQYLLTDGDIYAKEGVYTVKDPEGYCHRYEESITKPESMT